MWLDCGATTEGVAPGSPVTIAMGTRTEAGTVDKPNPFRETISGLTASTTYAYRVRGSNEWGAATSAWVWFATHPADFILTSDLGWPRGGYYDGYDYLGMDGPMPGWRHGTTFTFR